VHFRVWAPKAPQVSVVFEARDGAAAAAPLVLEQDENGYHHGETRGSPGDRYRFRLGDGDELFADPASRFQPDGPFGPSEIVNATDFEWHDHDWPGPPASGLVVYEMHVGTFTREGTWRAAADHLARLAELGVNVIEMMPIADFAGRFGWGYDGVCPFAPTRLYGRPDDLRAFIDRAHATGLAVILDVVYNHFGPAGAFFSRFADGYFSDVDTEWGQAINFDGPNSSPVRELFISNAGYWIDEFHFDGLRLDATQSIFDRSPTHILAEISQRVRDRAGTRSTWIVAENERQDARLARRLDARGYGLDALWNDDFHHTAVVALTGHRDAYYTDYMGRPQEFISAAKHGFLYQGQWYRWQRARRGHPALDLAPPQFVACLENHDQVANSGAGIRLHQLSSPGRYRALIALTLLGPWTPMLFQGQEFGSTAPFLFFADHEAPLSDAVRAGRAEFLKQFPRLAQADVQNHLTDPGALSTFERCKLHDEERERMSPAWSLHTDLLRMRRSDPTIAAQGAHGLDGAVLSDGAFLLRFFGAPGTGDDRVLLVNLGGDVELPVLPEPLLAPPADQTWTVAWSSEALEYDGPGLSTIETNPGWMLPSESAVLLAAAPAIADGDTT
jgi:maltooligosyltrehalose trehalohydrolase